MCSETSVATEKKYIDTFQSRRWMMSMLDRDRKREREREKGRHGGNRHDKRFPFLIWKKILFAVDNAIFGFRKIILKIQLNFAFLIHFSFSFFFLNCYHSNFVAESFGNKSAKLSGTISWSISQSLQSLAFIMIKSLACSGVLASLSAGSLCGTA